MILLRADWNVFWLRLVGWVFLLSIIGIIVLVVRYNPARCLRRIVKQELSAPDARSDPLVNIVFHTTYGCFVFSVHSTHKHRLSVPAAERLLYRLHRFNRFWGMTAPWRVVRSTGVEIRIQCPTPLDQ